MANYETLKSAIQQVVKQNGNNEITGALLQQSLLAMINSLGAGYQCAGIATTDTKPGTPDQRVFYLASQNGTYKNFGGIVLYDEIAVLLYDGEWLKESLDVSLNIEDLAYVEEDGFFIVDENLNIGFAVNNDGAKAKNIINYEIID